MNHTVAVCAKNRKIRLRIPRNRTILHQLSERNEVMGLDILFAGQSIHDIELKATVTLP